MRVTVDCVKELELRSGKALRFNILVSDDIDPLNCMLVAGLRWLDGNITPPMAKDVSKRWWPTIYIGQSLAFIIYEEVKTKLISLNLLEKYPLNLKNIAIEGLWDNQRISRFLPGVYQDEG